MSALALLMLLVAADPTEARRPASEADLRAWLENMSWHHRYSVEEISAATGLSASEVSDALKKYDIRADNKPRRPGAGTVLVLPYPGGRHPRIGFLDGAIRPQRETKFSVFLPWDESAYVVVDAPEAIWSNLGLTYLAHTHIDTIWTKQKQTLEPLEWTRRPDGSLECERRLPNGIVFGTRVIPEQLLVRMEMWLRNGTQETLRDLRVQNCVLLKGATGFTAQSNDNKVFAGPYAACKSADGKRWIITAWEPLHRAWGNPPCPCLHSDPRFPDCAPGETQRLKGLLSFYQGEDIQAELRRLDATGWRQAKTICRGEIVDAATGQPLPARIYLQGEDGGWHFPCSESASGTAIPYRRQRGDSVEMHTTLSAHPFTIELLPGQYTVTIERGKEYLPLVRTIRVAQTPLRERFELQRWINLAERGWYSGDTHIHRTLEELPNVMLAEDLNVGLPLTYWVTEAFTAPGGGASREPGRLIAIDPSHVIYPRNTEYEIFTVGKQRHALGACFVLNHRTVLDRGVPPLAPLAERVRREGALLELDKHNWPWSMALVPLLNVDLYELSNNHVWRAPFGFPDFGEPPAEFMKIDRTAKGLSEAGWIDFTLKNYYTLLNCGFRMRPTAGTANGVHPVPLGFGRVYVELPDGFSYEKWLAGLNAGRSFVSTGPMLLVQVNNQSPGHHFEQREPTSYRVAGTALSAQPLQRIEIIVNGEVARTLKPANMKTQQGGWENAIAAEVKMEGSSWLALRCFEERPDGRVRFAHTAPWYMDVPGQPFRPRRVEIDYLIRRVEEQIARSKEVLPAEALAEYQQALAAYRKIAARAQE